MLRIGYVEIGEENNFKPVFHIRVVVYHITYRVYQLDHKFSCIISRCCLATKNECARHHINVWVLLNAQIKSNDIQYVKVLPFILMNSLYLYVEHGRRINEYACPFFD